MHFIRVEDWDDINYWITCCMDNTGGRIFNAMSGRDLVIDPNPQDMAISDCSSRELMWLWWGHLSDTRSMVLKGCNIGDWKEDARCEGEKWREG